MAGGAPRSEAVRRAHQVIENAWVEGRPYDLASQAAFALESACLLQSPETAAEHEALRKSRDEFRDQRNAVFQTNEQLHAKVEESGQARLRAENEARTAKRETEVLRTDRNTAVSTVAEQAQLLAKREREHDADRAELETLRKRVAELAARPSRADVLRSFAARVDRMRENGDPSVWLSAWEAVTEVLDEAHRLAAEATRNDPDHVHDFQYSGPTTGARCVGCHLPEDGEGTQGAKKLDKASLAQPAAAPELTVYRAQHDSIVMGLYTTASAARAHCEKQLLREWPNSTLDWIEDEVDGVAELAAVTADGQSETETGYVVTALTVASAYDEEADE